MAQASEPSQGTLFRFPAPIQGNPLVAVTYAGLEQVLAEELTAIGARDVQVARRAVTFAGNMALVYRANYTLRTALRILVPVRTFDISRTDDLYLRAVKIRWEELFDVRKTFAVQSTVFSDLFPNSMYASLKLKDAIADRFRKTVGIRPSVNTDAPDIVVNLHIAGQTAVVSLDSSGESLHKRGYRTGAHHEAPISEVLAAGLLRLSGWTGKEALLDPMCGSGTIAIEAAMQAVGILPGEIRRKYAFQHWKNYDPDLFLRCGDGHVHRDPGFFIYASDIAGKNVDIASKNAVSAKVDDLIRLKTADFRTLEKKPQCSFLVFNPPYGERLNPGDALFYSMIGERLKHAFTGSVAWVISTDACFKTIGLKASQKIPLFNGPIACSFRKFETYHGSVKKVR